MLTNDEILFLKEITWLKIHFWMWKPPPKNPLYQLILLFNAYLQPQDMNLTPSLMFLLLNFLPVLPPIIIKPEIPPPLEVWVCLFHQLFLHHIHHEVKGQKMDENNREGRSSRDSKEVVVYVQDVAGIRSYQLNLKIDIREISVLPRFHINFQKMSFSKR